MLARQLLEAVEAHLRQNGGSYAAIGRAAGLPRGYVDKLRAAVGANPDHRVESTTLERVGAAIGKQWVLVSLFSEEDAGR